MGIIEQLIEKLLANQPPELYRYAPLDTPERIAHLKDVVINNRLWCASPTTFNDPFDLRPFQSFDDPKFIEDYMSHFRTELRRQHPLAPASTIEEMTDAAYTLFKNTPDPLGKVHSFIRKSGICCLTESGNNLLLWAHYTRGHNGYVLKFEKPYWRINDHAISYKVEYGEKYPTVNTWKVYVENLKPPSERNLEVAYEFTRSAALMKSSHWAYEKEWRIISPEPGFVNFAPSDLTQIIFGVAVQSNIIEEIRKLTLQRQSPIQLLKAELGKNTFSINYVPV